MRKITAIIIILVLMLSGCVPAKKVGTSKLKIVTSFYPIMLLTKAVVGDVDGVTIQNMTKPQTGCLHDYTLLPEDMKTLEAADVFVINGLGMESFLQKVVSGLPNLKIIDLSKNINAIEDNPHIWLAPKNAMQMVRNLSDELSKIDKQNLEKYVQNSSNYIEILTVLDDKTIKAVEKLPNKDIITFHEAFPYYAQAYGLNIKAVIEREPGDEPTAAQLKETVDIIRNSNARVLFTEPQYPSSAAKIIANETGANLYVLDPVVTGDNNANADEYIKTMEKNLLTLIESLGGAL